MTQEDDICNLLIEAKIASNRFQAAHIATGCRLWELNTDAERLARAQLYRDWRSAQVFLKSDTASCFREAIAGNPVPQMDMEDILIAALGDEVDDGMELADYFQNLEIEEE